MYRVSVCLRQAVRPLNTAPLARSFRYVGIRALNTQATDFESKYADKLSQRAKQKGVSLTDLKAQVKETLEEEKARVREAHQAALAARKTDTGGQEKKVDGELASTSTRQDSSPVKPLSSILNLPRIRTLEASQVSALWTAYHASRSEGTGRGFLCASIPVDMYEKMASVGGKYPVFVLPLPRPQQSTPEESEKAADSAYEFYFMEWAFHEPPASPSAVTNDPFSKPSPQSENDASSIPVSTILFTPLIEYKMRNSFATPYLVLTHYTDLAKTHGIVLLRGEITPTSAGNGHMLSQEDAQVLSMGLQRFYLWNNAGADDGQGEKMLKAFHENPDKFDWQELLKYGTQHL
ncbi:hypothetical protein V5O48_003526 [Marasmius crinis-equi]|uniref:ATP11-domain-containing protein n=1 Tax=Marasmius crinis-equi TaxID=585013 RepID=A0ABR3FSM7_9AGAR